MNPLNPLRWLKGKGHQPKAQHDSAVFARPVTTVTATQSMDELEREQAVALAEAELPALMTGTEGPARIVSLASERQARNHPRSIVAGTSTHLPSAFTNFSGPERRPPPRNASDRTMSQPSDERRKAEHPNLALVDSAASPPGQTLAAPTATLAKSVSNLSALRAKLSQSWRGLLDGVVANEFAERCVPLDLTCGQVALLVTPDMMDTAHFKLVRTRIEREWQFRILHLMVGSPELVAEVYATCRKRLDKGDVAPQKFDTRFLQLYDDIVAAAIEGAASDIHFETVHGQGMVRLRVYGQLRPWLEVSAELMLNSLGAAFGSRIKEGTASMEQFSSLVPINFMTRQQVKGRKWEGRCNGRPHQTGYKLVQRLLESEVRVDKIPTLQQLGYSESQVNMLDMALLRQWGVILMLGATGSGKSTTLRTMMVHLPGGDRLARYSVESPAEYEMPGVIQYSVPVDVNDSNEAMTLKYTALLRDAMRQDPDVLMMGEIRDHQTARLAVEFAATDHRCLSTLHGPNVIGGLERLAGEEMAIPADTLGGASFLNAAVYQKLLPKLCTCRIPATDPRHGIPDSKRDVLAKKYQLDLGTMFVARPEGCPACKPKVPGLAANGTVGVTVAAEILIPTAAMHSLIAARNWPGLRRAWRGQRRTSFASGHTLGKTAFEHGLWLASQGIVSLVDLEKEFEPIESYEVFALEAEGALP